MESSREHTLLPGVENKMEVLEGEKGEEGEKKELETLEPLAQTNTIVGFLKKLSWRGVAVVCTYLLGYFNFSIAWTLTPLILSALRDQFKKDKRNRLAAAREAALTNEQAMIESRMLVDDLPSWVYFPDKERAEWINNIIKQLWPNVNNFVRKTLFETVEPLVKGTLDSYGLKGFKFERERVFLGQIPPRITGIKVYDEKVTSRNEIILDVDIVFASDMEIMFSLKGIKAKVSEVSLRGMCRVVFKPLISDIPLIGGIQVYFLSDPEIDYSLGGVAGALDIPGLSNIIAKIISEQVRNFIVLPNKFFLPLVENCPKKDLICPNTAGVLRVTLKKAKDLMKKDVALLGRGSSDPYAILTVGATTYKTPTINNNCSPVWELTYDFPIEVVSGQVFMMEFFDEDNNKDDEFLGRATVQTAAVAERGDIQGFWVDLEGCESGKAQVSLSWLPVTDDQEVVREISKRTSHDEHAKCILHIYIDSCVGLDDKKNPAYKPCPLVQISCAKDVRQTWPKSYTVDPVIEQGFVLLICSPHSDDIHLKILDTSKQNRCIGTTSVSVWDIIKEPGMEYPLQPWILKGAGADAKITMSVSVRGLVPSPTSTLNNKPSSSLQQGGGADGVTEATISSPFSSSTSPVYDETVKAGTIKLGIHKAMDLEKKDVNGKSDPYVVITYEDQLYKTKTCKNTVNPEWNHEEEIFVKENGDNQINIQLFDKDTIGKDEPLGRTSLDVRHLSAAGVISQVWDVLSDCKSGKILLSAEFIPSKPKASAPKAEPRRIEYPEEPLISLGVAEADPVYTAEAVVEILEDDPAPAEPLGYMEEDDPEPIIVVSDQDSDFAPYRGRRVGPGFLIVTVHRALDLVKKDMGGKSDPYVVIRYGDHKAKSKVHKNNLNPEFQYTERFVFPEYGPTKLFIELMDDDIMKDESLGSLVVEVGDVVEGLEILQHWSDLDGVKTGKILYSVKFTEDDTDYLPDVEIAARRPSQNNIIAAAISPALQLASPTRDIGGGEEEGLRRRSTGTNGRIRLTILYDENNRELKLFVHEAVGLPGGDLPDPPDPYVKIYLMPGKKKKKKTNFVKDSGNPRFDEEFDFDIAFNKLQEHSLKISVVDKKGVFHRAPVLGTVTISLDNPGITQGVADWFPLHHEDVDSD